MLGCEVICDLMVVYASGEASRETRKLVEEHLARCAACREALGKAQVVEDALIDLDREQEPSNGGRFIAMTRRLLFAVAVGTLLVFGTVLAGVKWLVVEGMTVVSMPRVTGQGLVWVAVTAAMLVLYLIALLWRARRGPRKRTLDVLFLFAVALPLLVVAVAGFYLLGSGAILTATVVMVFLLTALAVTFVLLPGVPYMTVATALVLVLVNGFLLAQTVVGIAALSDFSFEWPTSLGHPADGVALRDAALVDLAPLGLEPVSCAAVTLVGDVEIGASAKGVRATYEGDGRRVLLTVIEFPGQSAAAQFFGDWKDMGLGLRISELEINLPGQGRIARGYDANGSRAYSAWQTGNWVTIVEVPGPFDQASPLAREVKGAVSESYRTAGRD